MIRTLACLALALAATGCQMNSTAQVLQTEKSQAAQRAISTRYYETEDQDAVFAAVLAALQDLEFVVDRADSGLGTVSAPRFGGGLARVTVPVRAGRDGTIVR